MPGKDKDSDFDEDLGPNAGSVPQDLFTWVVDEKVVGMSRPWPADLAALKSCGVTHVISLTLKPLAEESLSNSMMTGIHIPILDMSAPSTELIERFVQTLSGLVEAGHKVAVHCGAGLGRTGTMLAGYLVSRGMSAQQAIAEVRRRRPGSVESRDQERAVRDYQAHLRSTGC